MMSGLFVPTAKQGQPKLILSLGFHTSNPSTPSPYHTDLFRDTYFKPKLMLLFTALLLMVFAKSFGQTTPFPIT
ncbi:hypothetical protein Leryth_016401 [Lithospermum erythrorhizon]|nr:hypothetical protein Leryth_016401 [Lithospermum erythrorhizon]